MLLISALAMVLLNILGATGEALEYDRLLKANTAKCRPHFLFRQGLMLYDWLATMPDRFFAPLMRAFAENLSMHPEMGTVFALGSK